MEQLIDRPSVVRSAEVEAGDLLLTINLYDIVAPPPMPKPVLELTLHDCASGVTEAAEALRGATIWEIEQEGASGPLTLTFHHDVAEIASVGCQRVSSARRPFEEADWLDLVGSYERWARREQDEVRRLRRTVRDLELALAQRTDRARRIVEQSGSHTDRAAQASSQLKVLEEVANVLRAALDLNEP